MYPSPQTIKSKRDGKRFVTFASITPEELANGVSIKTDDLINGIAHFSANAGATGSIKCTGTMYDITKDIEGGVIDLSAPTSTKQWVAGLSVVNIKSEGAVSGLTELKVIIERW